MSGKLSGNELPPEVHDAIRHWSEDMTNIEPWREATFVGENLANYLYQAGYQIEPLPKTKQDRLERARSERQGRLLSARENGIHTDEQWQAMLAWAGNACVKCSVPFSALDPATKDHIIPLVNGGDDSIQNIQPLCLVCNSTKGANTADYRKPGWWEIRP